MVSVNYLAYKNALKQAWKDGKMSADESAMLDTLRKSLNISPDEHVQIEEAVRSELGDEVGVPGNPGPTNNNQVAIADENPGGQEAVQLPEPPVQEAEPPLDATEAVESDIKTLLAQGKNSYHKGNYEEAIEYCDKVLLMDPDNSEALFFRKRTLSKIEKLRGKKAGDTVKDEAPPADADVAAMEANPQMEVSPPKEAPPATGGGGDPNCKSCKGSGECHWCKGSGSCYWCKGSGNCDKCNGSGKINGENCKSCKGTGKCHSCNGDGKCYWCHGSGKCSKCS
ncbi:tetratricopeptide repeat protein [[Eubacterium] cellulosolvens]